MRRIVAIVLMIMTVNHVSAQPTKFDFQGHRGARGLAPENTIPAMLKALEYGVTTLELDIVITKDEQIVVSHEPWFNHEICTNPDGTIISKEQSQKLLIYEMTYEEVKTFDCGSNQNPRFPEQVPVKASKPLLKEVVAEVDRYCIEHDLALVNFNIETKCIPGGDNIRHPAPGDFARRLYEEIYQLGIAKRTTVQSFDVRTLQQMQKIDPDIKLVLLVENENGPEWNIRNLGFLPTIYSPYYKLVKKKTIDYCHSKGMKIVPWTVNEPKHMKKLIRKGVDGLITDYPDRGRVVLDRMK